MAQRMHCVCDQVPPSRALKQSHSSREAQKMSFKVSDQLLTGFDIQMKHGPVQIGALAEEEGGVNQIGFPSHEKSLSDIFTASA